MSNALTGGFDAVLEVRRKTVRRFLAAMHEHGGESLDDTLPRLPHNLVFRIGDDGALGGVRGQVLLQVGVPQLDGKHVVRIEEKPEHPKSQYAVIGIYMYDARVFEIISALKPSGRGELEITDVNNAYIARNEMTWDELEGWWSDAGTHV